MVALLAFDEPLVVLRSENVLYEWMTNGSDGSVTYTFAPVSEVQESPSL